MHSIEQTIHTWIIKLSDEPHNHYPTMTLIDESFISPLKPSSPDHVQNFTSIPYIMTHLPIADGEYWLSSNESPYNPMILTPSATDPIKTETINLAPMSDDEKLSALDELFYRSKNYHTSQNYLEALGFVVKLKNIAPFNAWLLRGQNPDITHVATASEWRDKFRRVLAPKTRAYIILRQFGPIDFVYDISDTIGEPLPEDLQSHFKAKGELNPQFVNNILQCCSKKGIKVIYDNTLQARQAGWAAHNKLNNSKQITINQEHTEEVQFSTLCHEIAHLMLGHLGVFPQCQCESRMSLNTDEMEVEAESVSWLVCKRLGIETDADRYLHECMKDSDNLLQSISIEKILLTAGRIEKMALNIECNVKKPNVKKTQPTLL